MPNRVMDTKRRSLLTVFFIFFIDNFGYALVFPLFAPLLLNPQYGLLPERMALADKNILLGILISAYPVAQFFGAPFFGELADRIGRKKGFFFTMGGITLGYCLTALALTMHSYLFILFGRLFTGFFAGNWSIVFATIADLSEGEKERGRNLGWNAALAGCSWVLSMLVGGDLSDPSLLHALTPAIPLWIAALLSFAGFLMVFFLFQEPSFVRKKVSLNFLRGLAELKAAFTFKQCRLYYLVLFCYSLSWMASIAWLNPTLLEKFHKTQIVSTSVLMAVGVVWGISSSLLNPPLIASLSLKKLTSLSLIVLSLFLILSAFSPFFWLFGLFYLLSALVAPLFWSNMLNLISVSSKRENQGAAMGISQSIMSLAQIIAPLAAASLSFFSSSSVFIAASLVAFLGFLLLTWRMKEQ